jgi:SAM-dependent methyltransferase
MACSPVMIELGCGMKKLDGYIGIDRFPFPCVDIVADLNKAIPFSDDSVDVIYACHSLEHLQSTEHIMNEIYRVGKNHAIIMILAPYYFQTLNVSNFYHKSVYTEDTFRFLTPNNTEIIPPEEYKYAGIETYGQSHSDNSESVLALEPLYTEYFYYEPYRDLAPLEKLYARKSFLNVCDQFYTALVINKTGNPMPRAELESIVEKAKALEPKVVSALRERDMCLREGVPSIYNHVDKKIENSTQALKKQVESSVQSLKEHLDSTSAKTDKALGGVTRISNHLDQYEQDLSHGFSNIYNHVNKQVESSSQTLKKYIDCTAANVTGRMDTQKRELTTMVELERKHAAELTELNTGWTARYESLAAHVLDQAGRGRTGYIRRHFRLFRRGADMFAGIRATFPRFADTLVLNCSAFGRRCILTLSDYLPFSGYYEYALRGYGNRIVFFIVSLPGSRFFVETVQDGVITGQECYTTSGDGPIYFAAKKVQGKVRIRFRALDGHSLVRVLEVNRRAGLILARKFLAASVDEWEAKE